MTFHSRTTCSAPAAAMSVPSGLNAAVYSGWSELARASVATGTG